MDLKFIVSGIQLKNGVESTALAMARAFFKAGGEVVVDKDYLSTIYGGEAGSAYYQIRISDKRQTCPGDEICDVLVALELGRKSKELPISASKYLEKIKPGGMLLYDSSKLGEVNIPQIIVVGIPAYEISKRLFPQEEEQKINLLRNSVLMGALFELYYFDPTNNFITQVLQKQFGDKVGVTEKSLAALKAGRSYVRERPFLPYREQISFTPLPQKRLFLSGNEAISISALNCGAALYTGYPITPASGILEFMEKNLHKFGGRAIQAEDEIAAAMMALGASYGGALAFDATSGPGLSLKIETIGHAGMTETGLVIIDAQRAGPSTGMPTKTEQSDLMLAIYGHHGEIPKIVLAPGDVRECFEIMPRAFYLARKYQMPVIIMTALDMAEGWQTSDEFDLSYHDRFDISWHPCEKVGSGSLHERYADTTSGISPQSLPGEKEKIFKMGGAEHDKHGFVNTKPDLRNAIVKKRLRKMETFLREDFRMPLVSHLGPDEPEIIMAGWGSTQGVMLEAQKKLTPKSEVVHFVDLWPLKSDVIKNLTKSGVKIFVIENNATGQLAQLLRLKAAEEGVALSQDKLRSILRYDGRPMEPRVIVQAVEESLGREAAHHG